MQMQPTKELTINTTDSKIKSPVHVDKQQCLLEAVVRQHIYAQAITASKPAVRIATSHHGDSVACECVLFATCLYMPWGSGCGCSLKESPMQLLLQKEREVWHGFDYVDSAEKTL